MDPIIKNAPTLTLKGRTEVKVSRTEMLKRIDATKGNFFTLTFIKKEGEERTINCNRKKDLSNKAKENAKLGLMEVYSIQDCGHRLIDTRTISLVNIDNQLLRVKKDYTKKKVS